jgi:hypothetical protein
MTAAVIFSLTAPVRTTAKLLIVHYDTAHWHAPQQQQQRRIHAVLQALTTAPYYLISHTIRSYTQQRQGQVQQVEFEHMHPEIEIEETGVLWTGERSSFLRSPPRSRGATHIKVRTV